MSDPQRLRPVPFALRLVSHRKKRSAVAAAGIGFAVLVIFVQLGFYNAVTHTAVAISSRFDADILLVSRRFVHLSESGTISRDRLFQTLALSEVEAVTPIYFRYARWRDPETRKRCRLFAIGFPLNEALRSPPLLIPEVHEQLARLKPNGTLLLDRLTQSSCGPTAADGSVEVREQAASVVGGFDLGVGFLADGALIVSDDSFSRFFQLPSLDQPQLGLIKLTEGADVGRALKELRERLPVDVRVISKDQLSAYQRRHWVENTAVGNIFAMGTIAGFLVGVVVLYQILSTDIRNHLPLYATLKAMGYSNRRLYRYVVEQSWIFAGLGFLPALILSSILFPLVHNATRLPVFMTFGLAFFVFVLSVAMCSLAAGFSLRRLQHADPAELF